MRIPVFAIALLLSTTIGIPAALSAQRSVRFGVAAGAAVPTGSFQDQTRAGPGWLLFVSAGSNSSLIGFRFDVSDYRLSGRQFNGTNNGRVHVSAVTANVVATLPVFRYVKPYAIGGVGVHPFKAEKNRKYDVGVNAGVGMTFPFAVGAGFIEARYHRIYRKDVARRYIPINMGIMF